LEHLPQTVTSQSLSASRGFKSGLLPPLLLVHASRLKQRHQQFHRLDRNSKDFLSLQKMFNFIQKSELALHILKHLKL
ncbi:hypothetical protein T10_9372, partial [Trichinella papuae]